MSDHHADEIRDLLARAMSDAPEPDSWADVEQRSRRHDAPAPVRRRTGLWLAAAACVVALVGALVVVVASDDEPMAPINDPENTTPTTPTTPATSVPAPTTAAPTSTQASWTGGLLEDIDPESLRPLDTFNSLDGNVIIPTAPPSWRVWNVLGPPETDPAISEWSLEIIEARPDGSFGQVIYLTTSTEPNCQLSVGCTPLGESATINGVEWASIDVAAARARVGDRWVTLAAFSLDFSNGPLLENAPIVELLEGLRVGSPEVLAAIGEACLQCDVLGKNGDPFATAMPGGTRTTGSDGGSTAASEPSEPAPSGAGSDTGRPLTALTAGDVVVPTYIPPGLALESAQILGSRRGSHGFSVRLETSDDQFADVSVGLNESDGTLPALGQQFLDDPNHPPVEIADVTWGWNDFSVNRIAHIGSFEIWVHLDGLDRSEAEPFIEGLRAVPIEQFPVPISFNGANGLSVTYPDDLADAEIVASDDRFELAALQVGGSACMRLDETNAPAPKAFARNCWRALNGSGIVDVHPIGDTPTEFLITGVIDSSVATAVRVTSPDGDSVVVPTGPLNQATDGRFFLARLDLDDSSEIRLDRFTIEDASP